MVRTQIQLTDDQAKTVKKLAMVRGVSMAEFIRQAVEKVIHSSPDKIHRLETAALLSSSRRRLSFVDCVSFEIMRETGIRKVFAFDPHFKEQGFEVVP